MYGGCIAAMAGEGMGSDFIYYWPTGQGALVGAEGAVNIMHGKQIAAAPEDQRASVRQKYIDEYNAIYDKPYTVVQSFHADEIILPSDTRMEKSYPFASSE